jgi:hypothetical protein
MYSFIDLKSFNKNDKEIPVKLDRYKTETLKPYKMNILILLNLNQDG